MAGVGGRITELSEVHQEEVRKMLTRFQAQRQEISLSLPSVFAPSSRSPVQSPLKPRAAGSDGPFETRPSEGRGDFVSMRRERDRSYFSNFSDFSAPFFHYSDLDNAADSVYRRLSQETRLLKAELRGLWSDSDATGRDHITDSDIGDASLGEYLTAVRQNASPRYNSQHPEHSKTATGHADELDEIVAISQLLRTEREIAHAATGAAVNEDARRDIDAQREALSVLQRQLQTRHIEIEARLRDVSARELQLKQGEKRLQVHREQYQKRLDTDQAETDKQQARGQEELEKKSKALEAAVSEVERKQASFKAREASLVEAEHSMECIKERERQLQAMEDRVREKEKAADSATQAIAEQERQLAERQHWIQERQAEHQHREKTLKALEKSLEAQEEHVRKLGEATAEQERAIAQDKERHEEAVHGLAQLEAEYEAREAAFRAEEARLSEQQARVKEHANQVQSQAAKVEATKGEVGRMANKLQQLIAANSGAEETLGGEREALSKERFAVQEQQRELVRRSDHMAKREAEIERRERVAAVAEADGQERERQVDARERALDMRERALAQAQAQAEASARDLRDRERLCSERDQVARSSLSRSSRSLSLVHLACILSLCCRWRAWRLVSLPRFFAFMCRCLASLLARSALSWMWHMCGWLGWRWHVWLLGMCACFARVPASLVCLLRSFHYSPYLLATNSALADLIVFEQGARCSKNISLSGARIQV